jgi:hypothetical protein
MSVDTTISRNKASEKKVFLVVQTYIKIWHLKLDLFLNHL